MAALEIGWQMAETKGTWDPMVREGLDPGSLLALYLLPLLGAWEGSGHSARLEGLRPGRPASKLPRPLGQSLPFPGPSGSFDTPGAHG